MAVKHWSDRGELEALMTGSSSIGLLDAAAETLADGGIVTAVQLGGG